MLKPLDPTTNLQKIQKTEEECAKWHHSDAKSRQQKSFAGHKPIFQTNKLQGKIREAVET